MYEFWLDGIAQENARFSYVNERNFASSIGNASMPMPMHRGSNDKRPMMVIFINCGQSENV